MISTSNRGELPAPSRRQAVAEAASSRVVPKPVPQTQSKDARTYQLGQIRKRFSPQESTLPNGTTSLVFGLVPSDPDFPFELNQLDCELQVPQTYPKAAPQLRVRNNNIPRGFGINVENGWDKLVQEKRGASLLALTNALDRNLEAFLSEQKADTVKLTIFKDTRHLDQLEETASTVLTAPPVAQAAAAPRRTYVPEESFTREQIAEAKARRAQEVRQIESRMGRVALYQRSSDGIIYTLPLEPKRRSSLPPGLQAVKSFQLIVPLLYPLQEIRILLNDVESEDAELVEELFAKKANEQKQMTLMSHINYLAQNLHLLAKQVDEARAIAANIRATALSQEAKEPVKSEEESSHIKVIPRPPEWAYGGDFDGSSGEDEEDYDSDEDGDEEGGAAVGGSDGQSALAQGPERGTALSFPSIELHGIELLQVSVLSISVKCQRCKTANEVGGLKPNVEKSESCKKCATAFTVTFRPELVHANSTRAGFIDTSGCTVNDMLPSTFVPTCGKCSTASPGLVSVRGETTTNVCRECHARFTFKIPDVRFLVYAPGSGALPPPSSPRRRTEKLGLHVGEPLPDRGACAHYRRSYRWFRFSCCSKVYPCDRCHDAAEGHVVEWANRMICGWCSREQNYSVESCSFCGRSVIGKRGKGYWEGGKGTRDRVLMSRKDKRKYRRVGGGGGGG
ncbi:uncharacterized protein E0L32_001469 [Thyridium curvatum]|uniref:CHY-type domain-containing protein n=1 Tax=Thyridium curvatum TaxID=1093900 RepID=A0A507AKT5_9PEZI|nr:uncharacterized protein E0L32_001469 [Thyridium curvatum]TPX10272.1 hypothetical protein E0L32_001469 [Thyridium curvatum]